MSAKVTKSENFETKVIIIAPDGSTEKESTFTAANRKASTRLARRFIRANKLTVKQNAEKIEGTNALTIKVTRTTALPVEPAVEPAPVVEETFVPDPDMKLADMTTDEVKEKLTRKGSKKTARK